MRSMTEGLLHGNGTTPQPPFHTSSPLAQGSRNARDTYREDFPPNFVYY